MDAPADWTPPSHGVGMTSRIDWSQVMAQLRERMSYPALHRCTGMSLGTLHNLANGICSEPRHSEGERLLELLRTTEAQSFRQ